MEKPLINLTEERNFSGVFNAVFGFIGQEFKPLAKTVLLYTSIPLIFTAITSSIYAKDAFTNLGKSSISPLDIFKEGGIYSSWYFISLFTLAISYFFLAGIVFSYLKLYREKGHGGFESTDVWRLFISKAGGLFGHQFLALLSIIVFMAMLVIPGIYVAIPLSLVMIVKIEEDPSFGDNWERCFYLVRNNWWTTFGILFVIGLIHNVMAGILSMPTVIYTIIIGFTKGTGGSMEINVPYLVVTNILSTVGSFVLYVMVFVAQGLQYYNLVEKKDRVSLIDKISSIEKTDAII